MRDVSQLHPELQPKIRQIRAKFPNIGIGECLRTVAEQDALYAQGRTKPGSIVTNAKGSTYSSQHQWGIAFDFFKNEKGHAYDDTAFFKAVGAYAKSIGLGWGGDWKSPVDMPHIYLNGWGSTTSTLKKLYGTPDKFMKTWFKDYGVVYDYEFYRQYKDLVKAFGNNAESYKKHFEQYGIEEGRRASKVFDVKYYKENNKDLKGMTNAQAIEHFLTYGINEWRQSAPDFYVRAYRQKNSDLDFAFGNNCKSYYEHYAKYGYKENRKLV